MSWVLATGMMHTEMRADSTALEHDTSRFEDTLVTRTIRAIEESGPLEDTQELREAARQASTQAL